MAGSYTERFTEVNVPLDRIQVGAHAGVIATDWVSVANYHRIIAVLDVGNAVSPLDMAIWQATNAAGAGAKFVTGKAITQLDGGDDNTHVCIEVRTEELDVDGGFDHVRIQTTNGGAGGNIYGAVLWGFIPRFAPVGTTNWDEVVD